MNFLLFCGPCFIPFRRVERCFVTLLRLTPRDRLRAPYSAGDRSGHRERERYMMKSADAAVAATALVVSKDALACELITDALRPLAIRPEICEEVFAAARLLDKQKFEAVMVDLSLGEGAMLVMEQLRFSRSNRTAVTFAIAAGDKAKTPGVRLDSTFVLPRPLSAESINQILRAAYGLVVRERRRYFRCPLAVPIFVRARQPEEEFLCQTINISEGGVGNQHPHHAGSRPRNGGARSACPAVPASYSLRRAARWSGQKGLVGLEFLSLAAAQKSERSRNGWPTGSRKLFRKTLLRCFAARGPVLGWGGDPDSDDPCLCGLLV